MENAQPEPSMEEILASIRRIISEDDDEAGAATKAPPAPSPIQTKPAAAPSATASSAGAPTAASPLRKTESPDMSANISAAKDDNDPDAELILDEVAATAASKAFTTLSQSVRISEGPGRTLEDVVVEMLKPMIKEWLDANLPPIVEEMVQEEIQRVSRRRRG